MVGAAGAVLAADIKFLSVKEVTLANIPEKPEEIFGEFSRDFQAAYGSDLVSIILYGSGAKGEYIPKKSDINFLITLTDAGIEHLEKALDLIPKWQRRAIAVPLMLTRSYIASALDVYPIEFLDMKTHYRLVFGDDVLTELQIDKDHLRLQIERELRGKLLSLRQGFLNTGNDRDHLRAMLAGIVSTLTAIFEALLFLRGEQLPNLKSQIFEKTALTFGLDNSVFIHLLNVKRGQWHGSRVQLQEMAFNCIKQIKRLIEIVDKM